MEPLDNFMDRLASSSPAPGGGAASSLVAIVGTSLNAMVAGLTEGKKGYEGSQKMMEHIRARSNEIRSELRDLMVADEEAFNSIVGAWKMPRATEEEKEARKASIQKATKIAIKVPWRIASLAHEVLRIGALLVDHGNRNAITDAGSSLEFARAAIRAVLLNVRINLKSLTDQDLIESEELKMKLFLEDTEEIYRNALRELRGKL